MTRTTQTHIKLNAELRRLLQTLAARKHITMSDVIRLALQEFAQREGLGVAQPQDEQQTTV